MVKKRRKVTKFSSQVDDKVFLELRSYAEKNKVEFSALLEEAIKDLLIKKRLSPVCKKAFEDVMRQYEDVLRELNK